MVGHHNDLVATGTNTPGLFVLRRGFPVSVLVGEIRLYATALTPTECSSRVFYLPES